MRFSIDELDMTKYRESDTARPVFVYYAADVEPSELHPQGVPAGFAAEASSPAAARAFHPDAQILSYADGKPYVQAAATREINAAKLPDEPASKATQNASPTTESDDKGAKGSGLTVTITDGAQSTTKTAKSTKDDAV